MAARVGTVLSDEHILKECAHYRPIPMKLASKLIDSSYIKNDKSPFSSKPLKYQRQLARPEHFDSYAHSLSRNLGNDPEFRGKLHAAYTADVAQHHANVPPAPDAGDPDAGDPDAGLPFGDAFFINHILPIQIQHQIQAERLEAEMSIPENQPAPQSGNTYDFGQDPPAGNTYDFGQDPPAGNTYDFGQDPIDEVGDVNPDDPAPYGEPSESSGDEDTGMPSSSNAPQMRRSTRVTGSMPPGSFSEPELARRGRPGFFF